MPGKSGVLCPDKLGLTCPIAVGVPLPGCLGVPCPERGLIVPDLLAAKAKISYSVLLLLLTSAE